MTVKEETTGIFTIQEALSARMLMQAKDAQDIGNHVKRQMNRDIDILIGDKIGDERSYFIKKSPFFVEEDIYRMITHMRRYVIIILQHAEDAKIGENFYQLPEGLQVPENQRTMNYQLASKKRKVLSLELDDKGPLTHRFKTYEYARQKLNDGFIFWKRVR